MALVAYDNSDESDIEDDDEVVNGSSDAVTPIRAVPAGPVPAAVAVVEEEALEDIVQPGETELALRQQIASKRKRVQILLPSINQIDSDSDEESTKPDTNKRVKAAPATGKCGLFSMLPPPTVGALLIPHKLTQPGVSKPQLPKVAAVAKPQPTTVPPIARPPLQLPKEVHKSTSLSLLQGSSVDDDDDDDDDENVPSASFFSLDAQPKPLRTAVPIDTLGSFSRDPSEDLYSFETSVSDAQVSSADVDTSERHDWVGDVAAESDGDDVEQEAATDLNIMQDEQFMRLCGGKRNLKHAIEIVDVRADDQLRDVDLTKSLSEEVTNVMSHSKKRNKDMPSSQQKRKHQITYLAYKAKEREMELKNQWAENKFNKRQTQSKYGF